MVPQGVHRILLVGKDIELLRRWVTPLGRLGAHVVVSDPAELETHIGAETFHVVILSETMPEISRRSAAEHAYRRWPGVKILELDRTLDVLPMRKPVHATIPDYSDELIRRVEDLLRKTG